MLKKITVAAVFCFTANLYAQDTTTVSFDSGTQTVYNENTGATIALTGGTTADGNGAVLQLGYFDGATAANNFLGNWVPLTGETSLNTAYNTTSIGDLNANGAGDGTFALSLNFVLGSATTGNSLPASNTVPLSIRFYNGTTLAGSTFYNIVSDDLWLWKIPTTPAANVVLSLDDLGLEWYSIFLGGAANTAFHTTILIPEPSTVALIGLGIGLIPLLRRRAKS